MKKVLILLALLLTMPPTGFGQTRKAPPPPVARQSQTTSSKTIGVSVERFVADINVNSDGTASETVEMLRRYETDRAAEAFATFTQEFNGDLQTAEVLEAYALKADGTKKIIASDNLVKLSPQAEAAPSFSSVKMIEIKYGELAAGDRTFFRIRLKTVKPMFGNHFDSMQILPVIFGWKSAEINLTAPADYPLGIEAVGLDGGRIADEKGRARWQWRRRDLPAIEIEEGMYDFIEYSPRVAITSFQNYDQLGAAYWSEAKKKAVITPEIEALANRITAEAKTPVEQAYAIYEWVNKNIRYLSIVLDRSGWIPHSTEEILTNGYGDCKDYTTILYALLRVKNIESYPVIIRADAADWFPETATPEYFNHAILYIPSLAVFADATAPNTRLGMIPLFLTGKKAFLAGEKTGVVEIPPGTPADNRLVSDTEIGLAPNGDLKAVSKSVYQGRTEIVFRPMFADSRLLKDSSDFVRLLLGYFGIDGSGKLLKVGNPFRPDEPFSIEMEVDLPNYTTFVKNGELSLPVGLNMMNAAALEQFVREEKRATRLLIGAVHLRESFNLRFPAGVTIDRLPEAINFENALGSYRNEFKLENGAVTIVRELIINRDSVAPTEYGLVRELVYKAVDGYNLKIKYRADPALARLKSKELKTKPPPPARPLTIEELIARELEGEPKLTARQAAGLEAELEKNPDNVETRKRLLRHYSAGDVKAAPARARLRHRLWFIQHRPEMDDAEIFGSFASIDEAGPEEFQTLKGAWLKQVAEQKTNAAVRLNAADFFLYRDPEAAEKILLEGRRIDPHEYRFAVILSELYHERATANGEETAAKSREYLQKSLETGEAALVLIKKERSETRDRDRGDLLLNLVESALELDRFERAAALATELILDFGQDVSEAAYDRAAHTGNIVLGRIALRAGDTAKAKEHLLIAVRAPLRKEKSSLTEIDMKLAAELFARGEKDAVLEYLELCEGLWNLRHYAELYVDETTALKKWREQIRQNKTPSFDFSAP